MKTDSDPFKPILSTEQEEALKAGGRLEMWNGIPMVITTNRPSRRKTQEKDEWSPSYYEEQLALAKVTREPAIAALAELNDLYPSDQPI